MSVIRMSNSNIEKFEFNNVKLEEAMHDAGPPSHVHVRLVVNDVICIYKQHFNFKNVLGLNLGYK